MAIDYSEMRVVICGDGKILYRLPEMNYEMKERLLTREKASEVEASARLQRWRENQNLPNDLLAFPYQADSLPKKIEESGDD